jgi:hypothetical protein
MQKDEIARLIVGARLAVSALALIIGGCSSTPSLDIFSSSKPAATSTDAAGAPTIGDDDLECPEVTVRSGASTLAISGKGPSTEDSNALQLRYQGSIVRTARECHVRGTEITMKVGIEGRVVLGPIGGPGQIEVPLRLAVVQEGPQPKTILSKLARIPVTIGSDTDRVTFSHVDSDIVFPMPRPLGLIGSYVVYIGFDPNAGPVEKPKPAAKQKRKR